MTALHTAKPVLGAVETVTVSGTADSIEVDARMDTGAGRACIDRSLAEEIGMPDPVGKKSFRSSTDDGDTRPIIGITLVINGHEHDVEASVTDRSRMSTDLRLGRGVLQDYLVDVER